MRPTFILMIILVTLFAGADASAQERGFGRGRLFKKLREDIAKNQQKFQEEREKRAKEQQKRAKEQQQRLKELQEDIKRKLTGKSDSGKKGKTPTPIDKKTKAKTSSKKTQSRQAAPKTSAKKAANNNTDFGMVLTEGKGEFLVIKKLIPGGNAAAAGLKVGDKIYELGGAEIEQPSEVDEIGKLLSQGDQMEFKVESRNAKPRKVLVQWGTRPEVDEQELLDSAPGDLIPGNEIELNAPNSEGLQSVLDRDSLSYRNTPRADKVSSKSSRPDSAQQRYEQYLGQLKKQRTSTTWRNRSSQAPEINGPNR